MTMLSRRLYEVIVIGRVLADTAEMGDQINLTRAEDAKKERKVVLASTLPIWICGGRNLL
jgi:hypothetical protein